MLTPRQSAIAATSGPQRWGSLIAGDHAHTTPESAFPLLSAAIKQQCNTLESTLTALTGYAGATLILSYRIASHSNKDAIAVFVGCRRTADELENINGYTPVNPKGAISAINKILYSNDNTAFIMLLVDIIRIANHVTRN